LEYQAEINKQLREENLKLSRETQTGSLAYFSQDIHKIKREMGKLTSLMQDFVQGKEITLKSLLGLESDPKTDALKQITSDIQSIKSDLNTVLGLISDIHAEQFTNVICRNQ
jgi:phage-related protein